ncbi:MAG: MFS transporter [Clostridiales bacterium]|nr:MFS transporter [Clostridiales bacterium]
MEKEMRTSRRLITLCVYAAFFLIGITVTVFGPTMSYLMEDYNVGLAQAGLLVTFMALGRMLLVVFCGILSDYIGSKWVVIMGTACLATGLIGIGSLSLFPWALFFAFIAGIGHGAVDTAASSTMLELYPDKASSALNRANMFYAIGCLVGPLISGTILSFTSFWRIIYYINATVGLIITLSIAFQTFPRRAEAGQKTQIWAFREIYTSACVWLLALIMFLYSGSGYSINTWINKYMGDVVKLPVFLASGTLAIYNLGLALGRFVCSMVSERLGYNRVILLSSLGGAMSITLALFCKWVPLTIIGLGFTGFFFGSLFPTAIAIGGGMYPDKKGAITGILVMTAALGGMTVPAITGVISDAVGVGLGMKSLLFWSIAMVVAGAWIFAYRNKSSSSGISK